MTHNFFLCFFPLVWVNFSLTYSGRLLLGRHFLTNPTKKLRSTACNCLLLSIFGDCEKNSCIGDSVDSAHHPTPVPSPNLDCVTPHQSAGDDPNMRSESPRSGLCKKLSMGDFMLAKKLEDFLFFWGAETIETLESKYL